MNTLQKAPWISLPSISGCKTSSRHLLGSKTSYSKKSSIHTSIGRHHTFVITHCVLSTNNNDNFPPAPSVAAYRGPESFSSATLISPSVPPHVQYEAITAEVLKLVNLLPPFVRNHLESDPRLPDLLEVVMDLGRPPFARFPVGDSKLSDTPVSQDDLDQAVAACGEFGGDNRAGIDATLHRISAIRNRRGAIVGLTCRVGRAIEGSASMARDLALAGKSILLLGRPGVGKTTAIRELSRLLADEVHRRVVIVDTSNEIGGDGDVPHSAIGGARRMQVPDPSQQHLLMIEAVENHMPETIVIDEIGTAAEALASRTIAQRGVQLIATAHGNELENVMKNPSLSDLVGGITSVTLGDEEAKRRGVQKSVLEREFPPTFDVAIELVSREQWRIHLDVASAVDNVLLGREANAEVREMDKDGRVWAWPEDQSTDSDSESDDSDEAVVGGLVAAALSGGGGTRGQRGQRGVGVGNQRTSAGSSSSGERQPFPEAALAAARRGFVVENAENSSGISVDDAAQGSRSAATALNPNKDKKGGKSKQSTTTPKAPPLKVYLYGIDPDSVLSTAEALDKSDAIAIAEQIQDADAVVAARPRLKSSGWLRGAAQSAGIPVFSVRSASVEHVVKAIRTILGIDPSPGGIFSRVSKSSEDLVEADPRVASSKILRAETSISLVNKQQNSLVGAGISTSAAAAEGIAEAKSAIESIVLQQELPVELKPRDVKVVDMQVAVAKGYGLNAEIVGGGKRVRVLPRGWVANRP